jgi:endonuclease-8
MPEGDTIFRIATVLRRALLGADVVRASAQPQPGLARVPPVGRLVGSRVESVEARGKHLLMFFSGGVVLRSHLGMRGSWHRYRAGEPWRLPRGRATVVLETDAQVAVGFDIADVELLSTRDLAAHARLSALGPDLLSASFTEADAGEALRRLRQRDAVPLGEALLDQRAMAGLGNVYKSEVPFLERLDPWAPVSSVSDAALLSVVATARRLLAANVGGGRRVTTGLAVPGVPAGAPSPGRSHWVYGRAGRPCRRCGTLVLGRRQGAQARMTYWCPRCQT